MDFCHLKGVSDLSVNSFCSEGGVIPPLHHEESRKARWEYVLKLSHSDFLKKMSKGHAYRVKRAKKMGVEMQRVRNRQAADAHARLISASMQRRQERGENVTTTAPVESLHHLVDSGAAEIFQAVLDGQVVSSNFILLAEKAGYSHTQGTSPEGMDCGAAHFLIHEIACTLRDEGKEAFNLGGTDDPDPESGLVKFKTGFGTATERINLEAARFRPASVASCLLRRLFISGKG
jgi:lipid II:glycine glycyltransferase (peptidoglycan interpeptide bridge formation enzyme)